MYFIYNKIKYYYSMNIIFFFNFFVWNYFWNIGVKLYGIWFDGGVFVSLDESRY